MLQAMLVGGYFLYARRRGFTYWLGWLLLASAVSVFPWVVHTFTDLYERFPRLMYFPTGAYYAITPLLYGTVRSLYGPVRWSTFRWHFVPVLLEVISLGLISTLPAAAFERFSAGPLRFYFAVGFTYGVTVLSVVYALLSWRLLARNQPALGKHRQRLALYLVVVYLVTNVLDLAVHQVVLNETWRSVGELLNSVLAVLFIYWASIAGYHQQTLTKEPPPPATQPTPAPPSADAIADTQLLARARDYLAAGGYANPELSINVMARHLKVPRKDLSRTINLSTNDNFKNFVASYRITAAQQQLRGLAADRLSYDGIAREVGFRSKSTFYRQFKELTGETPGAYRDRVSA